MIEWIFFHEFHDQDHWLMMRLIDWLPGSEEGGIEMHKLWRHQNRPNLTYKDLLIPGELLQLDSHQKYACLWVFLLWLLKNFGSQLSLPWLLMKCTKVMTEWKLKQNFLLHIFLEITIWSNFKWDIFFLNMNESLEIIFRA